MPSLSAATTAADRPPRLRPHDSWWAVGAAGLLAVLALTSCLWASAHLHPDPALHTAALFVHLASMALGFGAVLVIDYYGLLWLTGRCTLAEALTTADRLHTPVWSGLAGLVGSGALLHPDLGSALTRTKLALVLVLTLNGLQARVLARRLAGPAAIAHPEVPALRPRTLLWGAATAAVSQLCWWGAVAIGFLSSRH
ncbi:hypothetical protein HEK616_75940 (plasmid) [Streptomyces nigrescens]|uniref:Integral membrane protein n=1 Tax=Streptomyces nigrescens TaxID=1920 RepID=A0ABN6R6S8_STRNI|nr:hypothetical protein [Streptomyces nigrescens]BDM74107.1 hypothetical protein HEK616_75940 [Streptomyces nigrescens]